jgi:hypothetical protein
MYTVSSVYLYGELDPKHFGTIPLSARQYLQVLTLDTWSNFYVNVKDAAPDMFIMMASFIIIQSFVLLKYDSIDIVS